MTAYYYYMRCHGRYVEECSTLDEAMRRAEADMDALSAAPVYIVDDAEGLRYDSGEIEAYLDEHRAPAPPATAPRPEPTYLPYAGELWERVG